MWRIPAPLIGGGADVIQTITSEVKIGDLYTYLGSPPNPVDVNITIDGVDVGCIIISSSFAGGSTFQFNCVNGGRILGLGGAGGDGTNYSGIPSGGTRGEDGTAAMSSDGFAVLVDIDDGFLLGGGGGGGGGGAQQTGAFTGAAGGGGGGGCGFDVTFGGNGGNQAGVPPGFPGANGGRDLGGLGGAGGTPVFSNGGGNGGFWGTGGQAGDQVSQYASAGFLLSNAAKTGGRAGAAFLPLNGANITFIGAKTEATLRSEQRILGSTESDFVVYGFVTFQTSADVSVPGSSTTGTTFRSDGNINQGDLSGGGPLITSQWLPTTNATEAVKYEIRERNGANDVSGTWASRVNVTPGDWSALTSSRTQSISSASGIQGAVTMMEIRRADYTGLVATFYCRARDENGV